MLAARASPASVEDINIVTKIPGGSGGIDADSIANFDPGLGHIETVGRENGRLVV